MGTKVPFRLEGVSDLQAALRELPKVTRRNVIRRILRKTMEPLAKAVIAKAPRFWGDLEKSLTFGRRPKLTRRQKALDDKWPGEELHFGTADPAGFISEFGRRNQTPKPFFRSEWESRKWQMLDDMKRLIWDEIMSSMQRFRRKAERRRRRR